MYHPEKPFSSVFRRLFGNFHEIPFHFKRWSPFQIQMVREIGAVEFFYQKPDLFYRRPGTVIDDHARDCSVTGCLKTSLRVLDRQCLCKTTKFIKNHEPDRQKTPRRVRVSLKITGKRPLTGRIFSRESCSRPRPTDEKLPCDPYRLRTQWCRSARRRSTRED